MNAPILPYTTVTKCVPIKYRSSAVNASQDISCRIKATVWMRTSALLVVPATKCVSMWRARSAAAVTMDFGWIQTTSLAYRKKSVPTLFANKFVHEIAVLVLKRAVAIKDFDSMPTTSTVLMSMNAVKWCITVSKIA
jgi:hypothetical protein